MTELELGFTMYHIGPWAFLSAIEESRKLLSIPPIIIYVANMKPMVEIKKLKKSICLLENTTRTPSSSPKKPPGTVIPIPSFSFHSFLLFQCSHFLHFYCVL